LTSFDIVLVVASRRTGIIVVVAQRAVAFAIVVAPA
jgi:hypothetical protein